jgi:hypothetical protein
MISGDTAPSWPALIVADAALWFSRRLLAVAKRSRRRVALGTGRDMAERADRGARPADVNDALTPIE